MPTHRVVKLDELSQYFHMPEKQVAKQLGVCLTSLKKICRQNGITRWPYRKLKSLDKKINKIENALTSSAEDPSAMLIKWEMLKLEKKNLPFAGNPGDESDAETKKRSPVENTGGSSERASALTTPQASPPHSEPHWHSQSQSVPSVNSSSGGGLAGIHSSSGSRSLHSLLERKLRNVGSVSAHREALAQRSSDDSLQQPQQQQQQQQPSEAPVAPAQSQPQRLRPLVSSLEVDDDIPVPLDSMMTDDERARLVDLYCNPLLSGRSVGEFRLPDMLSPANAAAAEDSDIFNDFAFSSEAPGDMYPPTEDLVMSA